MKRSKIEAVWESFEGNVVLLYLGYSFDDRRFLAFDDAVYSLVLFILTLKRYRIAYVAVEM